MIGEMKKRKAKEVKYKIIDPSLSLLEQERELRGWSREDVEKLTGIPASSLYKWEKGLCKPDDDNIALLCKLYGKSPEALGLAGKHGVGIGVTIERVTMTDHVRRLLLGDLTSTLTSLVNLWPKRDRRYGELQGAINKAVVDYNTMASSESVYITRRDAALTGLALIPIRLCGLDTTEGLRKAKKPETDIDTLLKHSAAGIAACWNLRRGKDLRSVQEIISLYVPILQPILFSQSEAHCKASAGLLTQSLMLKGSLARDLTNSHVAIAYNEQAIQYSIIAEDPIAQALAHRMQSNVYYVQKNFVQALASAEQAATFLDPNMDTSIQSFIYTGLASSQAAGGKPDQALSSLKQALNLFDPTVLPPAHIQFSHEIMEFNCGRVYRDTGKYAEAAKSLNQAMTASDASALGKIQDSIACAGIEACRNDQTRNMQLCIDLWTQGITGARELDSQLFIQEARECYPLLCAAWPREQEVEKLRRHL
jgi:tetratricopeptide (TPR) repeat protein/transcriptional regulator with XRE-family HTH domain